MTTALRRTTVHGRADERATIEALLAAARAGRSGSLVVRGEAGMGKSTLLDHAAAAGTDLTVLRGTGIESEAELPFAGLHLLLHRHLYRIDALPPAQAQALRRALGTGDGDGGASGDRFSAGLAVLTLLAELADDGPVLCLVDDAHWLDQASADALLFAARRLDAEGVVVVFAARDVHAPAFPAQGVPELRLAGLRDSAAAELLSEHAPDLPRHVREQIAAESSGNPLALLELADAQREGRLTGTPYRVAGLPAHSRIQHTFAERLAALPERTRLIVLVAAADGTCDTATVVAAGALLGVSADDLRVAEDAQLLMFTDNCLGFRHPLVRSAAYQQATLLQRLAAHGALAEVLVNEKDADRRAWHLASARTGEDEDVAAALECSAEHARARGGHAAVAAAYERAANLSPGREDRGRRLTEAARAAADAGQLDRASDLALQATSQLTDPVGLARAAMVLATVAGERHRPEDAHRTLADTARLAAALAPQLAERLLFWAAQSAWAAGDLSAVEHTATDAEALGADGPRRVRALARAATGLHRLSPDGPAALRELLAGSEELVEGCRNQPLATRGRMVFANWHLLLGEHAEAHDLALAAEREARTLGASGMLPPALALRARTALQFGRPQHAAALADEGMDVAAGTGQVESVAQLAGVLAELAALAGDERRVAERAGQATPTDAAIASSLLDLGLGRPETAADRLTTLRDEFGAVLSMPALPVLVEAALRTGDTRRAGSAAEEYATWAAQSGQPWARAVTARCRALLAAGADAEHHFATAAELHRQGSGRPFEQARTELLYGEWLRRERRRAHARTQLRSALTTFDRLGARPWAERARAELRATGESLRPTERAAGYLDRLTGQELQVVRLAARGLTNREIGERLYLSPRTVGYHLYKAYPKLGVASRGELAALQLSG